MARKNVPFKVYVHYTGKKTKAEIQEIYADFYVSQVKKRLENSGLSGDQQRAILDRLIAYYEQRALEKGAAEHS